MQLKEMLLRNTGPIRNIDLSFDNRDDGNPKPTVFVGRNGSGKSVLLSYITDSLIEIAKRKFSNIVSLIDGGQCYFRLVGSYDNTVNTKHSLAILGFLDATSQSIFTYAEKSGELDPSSFLSDSKVTSRFTSVPHWTTSGTFKQVYSSNEDKIESIFENQVLCYFPPTRNETPYWMVEDSMKPTTFFAPQRLSGRLDKELVAESTWKVNKSWVMSAYVDNLSDVLRMPSGELALLIQDNTRIDILRNSRNNIEKILSLIMQEDDLKLYMNYRNVGDRGRLSVIKNGAVFLPSLDNLSTGQSILFNMFTTILRQSELNNLYQSTKTEDIEGIVIINEIDSHIHADLQYHVLPELISIFPKIQFFISTHSPLFLLGLEKKLGTSNINIIDMPEGTLITSERFSEFEKSFNYYRDTEMYENAIEARLRASNKPIVFTEGPTDVAYIETALKVLGRLDIINALDIEPVGAIINGKEINGGDSGLDKLRDFVRTNPKYLTRLTMLLYDCDTYKGNDVASNLWVRTIPQDTTKTENTEGIEDLLPSGYFTFDDTQFLTMYNRDRGDFWFRRPVPSKGYGGKGVLEEFQKSAFCHWFCSTQANASSMSDFSVVVRILEKFMNNDPQI